MIYKILSGGWLLKIFVIVVWLVTLLGRFFTPADEMIKVAAMIIFANSFLYLTVASRLALISHSTMSPLLPNYFTHVKRALLVILGVSWLPTFMLLPDFVSWLGTLSILLIIATFLVIVTYRPKAFFCVLIPLLILHMMEWLPQPLENLNVFLVLAWAFPVLACVSYGLLSRLERFRGDPKQIEKIIALTNSSMNHAVTSVDSVPLKSQGKLAMWLAHSNLTTYRELIRSKKTMSNSELIATACQENNVMGGTSYLLLSVGVIGLLIFEKYLGSERNSLVRLLMILLFTMPTAGGAINLYQLVNNKKTLLQRIAVMPCFNGQFSLAFIAFSMKFQGKNYLFMLVSMTTGLAILDRFTLDLFVNIVLISSILFLFQFALMFWSWSSKLRAQEAVVWLLIFSFSIAIIIARIAFDYSFVIRESVALFSTLSLAVVLFVATVYRSYRVGLRLT